MSYLNQAARLIAARYSKAGKAVYSGNEPQGEALARAYRYWRQHGETASESLIRAANEQMQRVTRWPVNGDASYQNRPNERGGRWIENPRAAGLRFVGFSDELASIDHNGWYLDSEIQNETARGAVYQLPARGGRPVYVEAVRLGDYIRGKGWRDQCGSITGPAIVYLNERHFGEIGEDSPRDSDAARDAARGADSEAESIAEKEREYQDAWRAANDWQEAQGEMRDARKEARDQARTALAASQARCMRQETAIADLAAGYEKLASRVAIAEAELRKAA